MHHCDTNISTGSYDCTVFSSYCRFQINVYTKRVAFDADLPPTPGWFHAVGVFRIRTLPTVSAVYINGDPATGETKHLGDKTLEDNRGSLIVGRRLPTVDDRYCSFDMDELVAWNTGLMAAEAHALYAMYV